MTTENKALNLTGLVIIRRMYACIGFFLFFFGAYLFRDIREVVLKDPLSFIIYLLTTTMFLIVYFGILKRKKYGLYLGIFLSMALSCTFLSFGLIGLLFFIPLGIPFLISMIYLCLPKTRAWFNSKNCEFKYRFEIQSAPKEKVMKMLKKLGLAFVGLVVVSCSYTIYSEREEREKVRAFCDSIPVGSSRTTVFQAADAMSIKLSKTNRTIRERCQMEPEICKGLDIMHFSSGGFAPLKCFITFNKEVKVERKFFRNNFN